MSKKRKKRKIEYKELKKIFDVFSFLLSLLAIVILSLTVYQYRQAIVLTEEEPLWIVPAKVMTERPKAEVKKLTLKEAFAVLEGQAKVEDLRFWAYLSFELAGDGRADDYTITGWSESKKKLFILKSGPYGTEFTVLGNQGLDQNIHLALNIDLIRDSPELVREGLAKVGDKCQEPYSLAFDPRSRQGADFGCRDGQLEKIRWRK